MIKFMNAKERKVLATSILNDLKKGLSRQELADEYGFTTRKIGELLRTVGHYKKLDGQNVLYQGYRLPEHPKICPFYNCEIEPQNIRKSGFTKDSSIGQWKMFCLEHGLIFYNIEDKKNENNNVSKSTR